MSARPSSERLCDEVLAAFEESQGLSDPFFSNDRIHWRNDRIETALRCGMGDWLIDELATGGAFLSDMP